MQIKFAEGQLVAVTVFQPPGVYHVIYLDISGRARTRYTPLISASIRTGLRAPTHRFLGDLSSVLRIIE